MNDNQSLSPENEIHQLAEVSFEELNDVMFDSPSIQDYIEG